MFQVIPERIARLKPLFAAAGLPPNAPMLDAFFDGRAPGRAFVDDFRAPRACVVATHYSFVFFGGVVTSRFFRDALARLRLEQALHVVWPEERGRRPRTPSPGEEVERFEYRKRLDSGGARLRAAQVGAKGAEVRRIDAALLKRCFWRDEIVRAAGSTRDFLRHGLGYCLLVGGEIVSEAYACFWGTDRIEIGAVTHPGHRGRGYASAACAHLIATCEELGFQTYWSCDVANEASQRLAHKLGYDDPRPYLLLRFDKV